ncbi:MAG TPA: hypothetical protein PLD32_09290 [Saprospiraceae bacterium]|nr:hypothetical protein [Saprospiraceae bacterium]
MKTIISPLEVRAYSPADRSYPLDNIRVLLPATERTVFSSALGSDFYDKMLKDTRDFSKATIWEQGEYKAGDFVIYDGVIFESCSTANTSEPEFTNEKWKIADKFRKKEFNQLYENHLRAVLAFAVYKAALPMDTIRSSAKGLSVSASDQSGSVTASAKDIDYVQRSIQQQLDQMIDQMVCWIIEQNELYKTDPTKGLDFSTCNVIKLDEEVTLTGNGGRRIAFLG